jgi:DNA-binding response OmpR family regulator
MMPVMDGFNLLRKIREHSTIPHLFDREGGRMDKVLGSAWVRTTISPTFSIAELVPASPRSWPEQRIPAAEGKDRR